MATLNIKLEESKTEDRAIFMLEFTNDIASDIIKDTEKGFVQELKESGSIIPGDHTTKIQMILNDRDKIDRIKLGLAKRFASSLGIENAKK